jgi:hypothetical protein
MNLKVRVTIYSLNCFAGILRRYEHKSRQTVNDTSCKIFQVLNQDLRLPRLSKKEQEFSAKFSKIDLDHDFERFSRIGKIKQIPLVSYMRSEGPAFLQHP